MSFSLRVHHGLPYLMVELEGPATLADLCGAADLVGTTAAKAGYQRALLDLRATESMLAFTDHLQLGTHVAAAMAGLQRVASVASLTNRSGASEKAAQKSGLTLRTFMDIEEARQWLQGQ
ncbi:MAG: hypothetical protein JWP22_2229 [Ramlibacter sp.]|jgi:hypothetical protein|nr:hypothetical protein [Ramlibacter sp.]MDB5913554.1 hypothetical protein [Ramlibacter sp.]